MTLSPSLKTNIVYPDTDGAPMAESDPARDYLIYGVESLQLYFQDRDDVYVSGNMFIYYQQGVPDAVVAPDVFVIFGVSNHKRMSYKVWQEGGKTPDFILEITSMSTKDTDENEKPYKYARMEVKEYFQYDPSGDYLQPALKGSRLVAGKYQPIPGEILTDGVLSIHSEVLGLDLRLLAGKLRFYELETGKKLPDFQERNLALQQAKQARLQAEQALLQAEREREAEAQARLQAEQARLQAEQALLQAEREREAEAQARLQAEQERDAEVQARREAVSRLLAMGLNIEQVAQVLSLPVEEL